MSLEKKAIKGGVWAAGFSYFSNAVGIITGLILARILLQEDFGIFAFSFAIAEIIAVLTGMSFSVAAIQNQNVQGIFDTAFSLSVLQSLVLIFLSALFGGIFYIQDNVVGIFIFVIGLSFSLQVPAHVFAAYLEKDFNFKTEGVFRAVGRLIGCSVCLLAAYNGFGKWSLLVREILVALLLLFGFFILLRKKFKWNLEQKNRSLLIKSSINLLKLRVSEVMAFKLPYILIGGIAGKVNLGIFERSQYISHLPHTVLNPITAKVAYPYFAKVEVKSRLNDGLGKITLVSLYFLVPFGIFLIFYAEPFIKLLLGNNWSNAVPFLQALIPYIIILPVFEVFKQALIAKELTQFVSYSYMMNILVFSLLCLAFYFTNFNIVVLAGAYSVAFILSFVVLFRFAHQNDVKIKNLNFKKLGFDQSLFAALTLTCSFLGLNMWLAILLLFSGWLCLVWNNYRKFRTEDNFVG